MEKENITPNITFSGTVHQVSTGDNATLIYNANAISEDAALPDNQTKQEELMPETEALKEFVIDEVKRKDIIDRLLHVYNAHDFAFRVVAELRDEVGRDKAVKQRFIQTLLPFAPNFVEGNSINNIREQINKMLEQHKWPR